MSNKVIKKENQKVKMLIELSEVAQKNIVAYQKRFQEETGGRMNRRVVANKMLETITL